jgi:glutamine synthetase
MLGSSFSIAGPNIVLNTIVAQSLKEFADILEKSSNFQSDLAALIKKTISEHKRIIFNGNNYSDEWVREAEKRGLSNLKTTVEALPAFVSEKSVALFTCHNVFTEKEIHSRYEILLENYCKTLHIEALTMTDLVKKDIIPACISYQNELVQLLNGKKACGGYNIGLEEHLLGKISKLSGCMLEKLDSLENALLGTKGESDVLTLAKFYREQVFRAMSELRLIVDELETLVAKKYWPLPAYAEMLYSVN